MSNGLGFPFDAPPATGVVVPLSLRWVVARFCPHLEQWEPVLACEDYAQGHDEAESRCAATHYAHGLWDTSRGLWAARCLILAENSMCASMETHYGWWEDDDGVHTYPYPGEGGY